MYNYTGGDQENCKQITGNDNINPTNRVVHFELQLSNMPVEISGQSESCNFFLKKKEVSPTLN